MPRRHLTELEVVRLITLLEEGYSQRQVANLIGVSHSVVGRAYSRYQETGQYHRHSGQGRRRVTTSREDRVIARHARIDPFVHVNVIASRFYNHRRQVPHPITAQTVRNRLREAHLRSFRPLRMPIMLNNHHRRTRLAYARLHIRWNHRQWNNVLFTDESRFCLYGNDRRAQVWRRRGRRNNQDCNLPITAFHGGSVMVWAGISQHLRTTLVVISSPALTSRRYIDEILRPHVLPIRNRIGNRFILMQDNARPHTANITRRFLRENDIAVLNHPAMSPDLNPIEHVWDMIGRRLRRQYPILRTLQELAHALQQIWRNLPQAQIRRCINMRERLQDVIRNRGGNTRF